MPVKFQVVCPQNGTAVLKGLTFLPFWKDRELKNDRIHHPKGGLNALFTVPNH